MRWYSFIQEWWKLGVSMYHRHPWVLFSALLLLVLVSVLLLAAAPGTRYRSWLGSRKSRRTWLPFLLVLCVTCSIPPVLWYVGRLTPEENVRLTKSRYLFGIDVSHNQYRINWKKVKASAHKIRFVFVRATMGVDGKDTQFSRNWEGAGTSGFVRGVYHYFRPAEDPVKQFGNFSSVVTLGKGDLPPVLDVESDKGMTKEKLRTNVRIWLKMAEEKYKVRPIIYTGRNFYFEYLEGHVDGYPIWIAAYDGEHRVRQIDWVFHQFSENIVINGIRKNVDGNNFRGTMEELRALVIR